MRPFNFFPVFLLLFVLLFQLGLTELQAQASDVLLLESEQSTEETLSSEAQIAAEEAQAIAEEALAASDTADSADSLDDEEDTDEFDAEFGDVAETTVYDPLEGYNRFMTGVNDSIYVYALDPIRDGYRWVMPKPVRNGVGHFFSNLLFPLRFINNALQAKFMNTGEETLRFVINSTLGIAGIWDPAKDWFGLKKHPEDFGQTLGYWGVGSGPHIVLPILGPSNLRDAFSVLPDSGVDPLTLYSPNTGTEYGFKFYRKVNAYSLQNIGYQDIKKDALDLYPFLRDAYEQNRKKKIEE